MKTLQSIFKVILLLALTVILFSCKKDNTLPLKSIFNYSTFTDSRDGKTYKYIKIGTQEWMAENLAYRTASGSWFYNGNEAAGAMYGRLYTWDAAMQAVPTGWHLPTDEEWKQLEMTLGMSPSDADGINLRGTNEGEKLKSTVGWPDNDNGTNDNGTDEVGFSAKPGGFMTDSGEAYVAGFLGYWWTATESDNISAWFRMIKYNSPKVSRIISFKGDFYSVRCVKDE